MSILNNKIFFFINLLFISFCQISNASSECANEELIAGTKIEIFNGILTIPDKFYLINSETGIHYFYASYPRVNQTGTIYSGLESEMDEIDKLKSNEHYEFFKTFRNSDINIQLIRPKKGKSGHYNIEVAYFSDGNEAMFISDTDKCVWRAIINSYIEN